MSFSPLKLADILGELLLRPTLGLEGAELAMGRGGQTF